MSVKSVIDGVKVFVKKNKTTILAVTGVIELISAGVLAFKERPDVDEELDAKREELGKEDNEPLTIFEAAVPVLKVMWPSLTLTALGASSIIFGNRMSVASNAALAAAYQISERATENLTDAVFKTVGEKKANEIFDNYAVESVSKGSIIHSDDSDFIPTRGGHYMFIDSITGIKFLSSTNYVESKVNKINNLVNQEEAVTVAEFLEELDIPREKIGSIYNRMGWYLGYSGLLELRITARQDDQGRPVNIITYNFDPTYWNI